MLSWAERSRLRGGITEREFVQGMTALGFVLIDRSAEPDSPVLRFSHPKNPGRQYSLDYAESFAHGLARFSALFQPPRPYRRRR